MKTVLNNKKYSGEVVIPSSKSELHRLLFIAAMAAVNQDSVSVEYTGKLCNDVLATIFVLRALGSEIKINNSAVVVSKGISTSKNLDVSESGTTLRFLLPRIAITTHDAQIKMHGRLAQRPIDDFTSELEKKGMKFFKSGDILNASGSLSAGEYTLPGSISSQYISSLLLSLPFLEGDSVIKIVGKLESFPYVKMTMDALDNAGIHIRYSGDKFYIDGMSKVRKNKFTAFGDYSSATFMACIGAFSRSGIYIRGLNTSSSQGDSKIFDILDDYGAYVEKRDDGYFVQAREKKPMEVDVSDTPDMVMALAVLMSCADGQSVIKNCSRLRLKESDRISSTINMLKSFGVNAFLDGEDIKIDGTSKFKAAVVDTCNDHRIAMAASIFSAISPYSIEINDSSCVEKSYPDFFSDLKSLEEN